MRSRGQAQGHHLRLPLQPVHKRLRCLTYCKSFPFCNRSAVPPLLLECMFVQTHTRLAFETLQVSNKGGVGKVCIRGRAQL